MAWGKPFYTYQSKIALNFNIFLFTPIYLFLYLYILLKRRCNATVNIKNCGKLKMLFYNVN